MKRDFDVLDIVEEMEQCVETFENAKSALSNEAHDYDEGNGLEKDEQEDILNNMIYSMEEIIEEVKDSLTSKNENELTYCIERVKDLYDDTFTMMIDANIAEDRSAEYWLDKAIVKHYKFENLVNEFYNTGFEEIIELQKQQKQQKQQEEQEEQEEQEQKLQPNKPNKQK